MATTMHCQAFSTLPIGVESLFEWNKEVDKCPEGILKEEDVILYLLLAAELPGVVLGRDMP
jgi:hypothetical protein